MVRYFMFSRALLVAGFCVALSGSAAAETVLVKYRVVRSGSRDQDKYGRKLRDIRRGGKSLSDILIAEGLASRWEGQHHAWC